MNDLEERLRADLADAAADVGADLDPSEVLAAGHRARRTRLARRGAGLAAVVAVVGVGAWSLGGLRPPVPGVPAPAATAAAPTSAAPTPSVTVRDPLVADFDVANQAYGADEARYDAIRIAVAQQGENIAVTASVTPASGTAETRTATFPAGETWYLPWDDHLALAVIPDRLTLFHTVADASKAVIGDDLPLDGIGATAVMLHFDEAGAPRSWQGFIWQRLDGQYRDSLGSEVPTATVTLTSGTYVVYKDAALDQLGLDGQRGAEGSYSIRLSEASEAGLLKGGMCWGTGQAEEGWGCSQFGLLPAGSTDISLRLVTDDGSWGTALFEDGTVAVVATVRLAKSDDLTVVDSISYTKADGTVVRRG